MEATVPAPSKAYSTRGTVGIGDASVTTQRGWRKVASVINQLVVSS